MLVFVVLLSLTAGFSYVFLNQATWTSAAVARPRHAVCGFITAGLAFFAIPFMTLFTFGMAYWVTSVVAGEIPVGPGVAIEGKSGDRYGAALSCIGLID